MLYNPFVKVFLLFILFSVTLLYFPLNRQTPKFSFKTKFDTLIPLMPWTVWIYFSYYFLFPASIALSWNSDYAIPLLVTLIFSTTIASVFWRIFPNGVMRPQIEIHYSHHHRLLGLIYSHDRDCNGLPSGHVLHSFVACFFLAKLFPHLWAFFVIILLAISFSTLTTKQHYFLDMVLTLLFSPLIIELTSLLV